MEKILDTGTPVVLVLINGKPLAVKEYTDRAAAVLETWFPGEQGGNAIADVLFGDYNPGGKLPVTLLSSLGQYPMSYNMKPVSYKDYLEVQAKPNFCFGHGLSYTTFEYADLEIAPLEIEKEEDVKISLSIKNSGTDYGEEVVQLFIRDEIASLARPIKELKGFKRIGLNPGETKKLEFRLFKDQLSFYNLDMKRVVEPGKFKVMLGSSSLDIRLEGNFAVMGELYEVKGQRKFFSETRGYSVSESL